jgi:2-C-methyl-D-erythritol 4-phosphate cytidylyltransferase
VGRSLAIVPAAGSGERPAAGIPKAFVHLAGQTHIERALARLRASGVVDEVVVAVVTGRADRGESTPLDPTPAEVVLGGQ